MIYLLRSGIVEKFDAVAPYPKPLLLAQDIVVKRASNSLNPCAMRIVVPTIVIHTKISRNAPVLVTRSWEMTFPFALIGIIVFGCNIL